MVGTPLLRAYMHGYFLDNRLYAKAKVIAEPFAYETYRQKRVDKKMEEERRSRIALVRKLPKASSGACGCGCVCVVLLGAAAAADDACCLVLLPPARAAPSRPAPAARVYAR